MQATRMDTSRVLPCTHLADILVPYLIGLGNPIGMSQTRQQGCYTLQLTRIVTGVVGIAAEADPGPGVTFMPTLHSEVGPPGVV